MPSGKRARQQRQQAVAAPPPVRSKGSPGGARQASPRTLAIAGGVILVVIVAIVLAVVLSRSSTSGNSGPGYDGPAIGIPAGMPAVGNSSSASALLYSDDVAKLLKDIPQHGFVLGQPNAPVTLVEYIDLQCPVCKDFELNEFPNLVNKYVKTGKLKIEMKTWNIIDGNQPGTDDSLRGQKVTIAAAKQNKAFTFAEVLYNNQELEGSSWLTNAMVANIAASVDGLNLSQLATDANSSATQNLIDSIDAYANSRFTATPSFLLGKGNATPHYYGNGWGAPPTDSASLESAIDHLLK